MQVEAGCRQTEVQLRQVGAWVEQDGRMVPLSRRKRSRKALKHPITTSEELQNVLLIIWTDKIDKSRCLRRTPGASRSSGGDRALIWMTTVLRTMIHKKTYMMTFLRNDDQVKNVTMLQMMTCSTTETILTMMLTIWSTTRHSTALLSKRQAWLSTAQTTWPTLLISLLSKSSHCAMLPPLQPVAQTSNFSILKIGPEARLLNSPWLSTPKLLATKKRNLWQSKSLLTLEPKKTTLPTM